MKTLKRLYAVLSAAVDRLAILANAFGTIFVLFLVLVVVADVVARGIFNNPFKGSVELVEFSVVFIVFLQLPDVIRVGRMTRSDGFLRIFVGRHPVAGGVLCRALDGIAATLMGLIALTMYPEVIEAWQTGNYIGTPGVFTAPAWPIKLAIFLGAVMCSARWLLDLASGNSVTHLDLSSPTPHVSADIS